MELTNFMSNLFVTLETYLLGVVHTCLLWSIFWIMWKLCGEAFDSWGDGGMEEPWMQR